MFRSNVLRRFFSQEIALRSFYSICSDCGRRTSTGRREPNGANHGRANGINSRALGGKSPAIREMVLLLTMGALAARVDVRKAWIWKARPTISCEHFLTAHLETLQTAIERLGSGADVDGGAPGTLFRLSGVAVAEQGYDHRYRQR
jgi:hypothetical protein